MTDNYRESAKQAIKSELAAQRAMAESAERQRLPPCVQEPAKTRVRITQGLLKLLGG